MTPDSTDSGYTLVEAIIALTILMLGVVTLAQSFHIAAVAEADLKTRYRVLAAARSQLDGVGKETAIAAGQRHGRYEDGNSWLLITTPLTDQEIVGGRPYWVILKTYDRAGRELFHLETSKIAATSP